MPDLFDDTVIIAREKSFSESLFGPVQPQVKLTIGAKTHVGHCRKGNDDHYIVVQRARSQKVLATSLPSDLSFEDEHVYGMVVADGIGGSAGGEVASRLALETVFELAHRVTSCVTAIVDLESQQIEQRVQAFVSEVQLSLQAYAEAHPATAGMGTTWTSAHVFSSHAIVVHVGDSRAYLFRDGDLEQLTRDHTVGEEIARAGHPEDEARHFRHILTNSLGAHGDDVAADVLHVELRPGDRMLLCTDGLSDFVAGSQIAEIMSDESDAESATDRLIECALDAGGKDNVTAIVCDVTGNPG